MTSDHENKCTFLSSTLKVEENKVPLFFLIRTFFKVVQGTRSQQILLCQFEGFIETAGGEAKIFISKSQEYEMIYGESAFPFMIPEQVACSFCLSRFQDLSHL